MHRTLIRVSTVIINNLILLKPTVKTEGFEEEINIGFDGSTCEGKWDI